MDAMLIWAPKACEHHVHPIIVMLSCKVVYAHGIGIRMKKSDVVYCAHHSVLAQAFGGDPFPLHTIAGLPGPPPMAAPTGQEEAGMP
eukprot:scaffold55245_cov26-Tisochrysis_lutea.AAC.1